MTDSIFQNTPAPNSGEGDPSAQSGAYDQLVGPGKKYSSVEALAKGALEKDAFIETLKRETSELRQEIKSRLSLEEFLAKSQQKQPEQIPPLSSGHNQGADEQGVEEKQKNAVTALEQGEVQRLVREALAQEQSKAARAANLNASREELKKVFGEDYGPHLTSRAQDLGLDQAFVEEIATRSPRALLALLGEAPKTNDKFVTPPQTTRNSPTSNAGSMTTNGVRNEKYWAEFRRTNLKEYMKPHNQVQRHKDAQALGEKFFS